METQTNAINPLTTAILHCNAAADHHLIKHQNELLSGFEVKWINGDVKSPNYYFVTKQKDGEFYVLTIRGSVVNDKDAPFFPQADLVADWILEDMNIGMVYWPFVNRNEPYDSTQHPCVSAGAYIGFTGMMTAKNEGIGQSLLEYLLEIVSNGGHLIITGHSLGGNLARLYASYFAEILIQNGFSKNMINLVTFAAPASGNEEFITDLKAKVSIITIENTNDVIPHLPTINGCYEVGRLYKDGPSAAAITPKNGKKTIKQFYDDMGNALLSLDLDYKQPAGTIYKFDGPVNGDRSNNEDCWNAQVKAQHQIQVYADYLKVPLPPVDKSVKATAEAVV